MTHRELTPAERRAYRRLAIAAREVQRLESERKQRAKTKAEHRQEVAQ